MIPVGSVVEMRFPSDVRFLSPLLASCRDLNVLYGFSDEDGQRIELALEEAVVAILPSGETTASPEVDGRRESPPPLFVQFRRVPLGLRVVLRGFDVPLSRGDLDAFVPGTDPDQVEPSELGFFLLKHAVDQVTLIDRGGEGKELHFFKMLRRKEQQAPHPEEATSLETSPPAQRTGRKSSLPPIIGEVAQSSAPELAVRFASVLKGRGDGHDVDATMFREALSDRDVWVVSARSGRDGELAAVQALERHGQRRSLGVILPPLWGEPSVLEDGAVLRSRKELLDALLARARDERFDVFGGALGIASEDTGDQEDLFLREGFGMCALLPSSPGESLWRGAASPGIAFFCPFGKVPQAPLYVPKPHQDMVFRIYESLGRPPRLAYLGWADQDLHRKRSVISAVAAFGELRCDLFVHEYGMDFPLQLGAFTRQLLRKGMRTLLLHLPLELASTAVEAEEAEKLGYVFCGVLPGTPGGDELLYLHRQGVAPLLETLRPRGVLGRLLLESIRKACSS